MEDATEFNWSEIPYGVADLKEGASTRYSYGAEGSLLREEHVVCCIRDCEQQIRKRHRGETPDYCSEHGVSVSSAPTYLYKDQTRNFIIRKDVPSRLAKTENWRLGNETSEDALSWNVFASLDALHGLPEAFKFLTDMPNAVEEPELYLWGNRIIIDRLKTQRVQWESLCHVREELERGLRIKTEPDVILRVPGEAIVLIEAKFGSPNPTLKKSKDRFDSVRSFLDRYRCKPGSADPLDRKWISEQPDDSVLEQLCRNIIFAQWLASGREQPFVINLVRKRDAKEGPDFHQHLCGRHVVFFVRSWEDLFRVPPFQTEQASTLRKYLKNKTWRLSQAFDFPVGHPFADI